NGKSNDNDKNNNTIVQGLTGHSISVPIHWNSAQLAQNIFRAMRDRQCSWASEGTSEKGQTFRCYACLVPAMPG
ncbi:MAG: hypothetical protein ACP5FH_02990, partial [Terracidiphilus sp.]